MSYLSPQYLKVSNMLLNILIINKWHPYASGCTCQLAVINTGIHVSLTSRIRLIHIIIRILGNTLSALFE